ncbi:MAG: hypothetical protein ACE3JP_08595 [Ectobacillus sp.]
MRHRKTRNIVGGAQNNNNPTPPTPPTPPASVAAESVVENGNERNIAQITGSGNAHVNLNVDSQLGPTEETDTITNNADLVNAQLLRAFLPLVTNLLNGISPDALAAANRGNTPVNLDQLQLQDDDQL